MKKELTRAYNDFMLGRIEDISKEYILSNEEYKEAGEKATSLFYKIEGLLPKEYKHLIDEYDETCTTQHSILEHIVYREALKDGMQLERFNKGEGLVGG